jgi:hypothetical protein
MIGSGDLDRVLSIDLLRLIGDAWRGLPVTIICLGDLERELSLIMMGDLERCCSLITRVRRNRLSGGSRE